MSLFRIHTIIIAAWLAAMLIVIGTSLASGVAVTPAQVVGWLVLGCVPPSVLVLSGRRGQVDRMSQVPARVAPARHPADVASPKGVRE